MELSDIKKLADLARINMTEEEMASIAKDIDPVLEYVDQLKSVVVSSDTPFSLLKNIGREDVVSNESGGYTDAILREAPDTEKGYVKVKKVL